MEHKTIIIPGSKYSEIILTDEIFLCEGMGSYTAIYLKEENKLTVSKNLHWFEELLCPVYFFRAHKSFIVNLQHIKKIFKKENMLALSNGTLIPVSRSRKSLLWKRLDGLQ
jgi:two-component system LytT family response regulator